MKPWYTCVCRVPDVPLHLSVRRLPRPPSRHGHLMVMLDSPPRAGRGMNHLYLSEEESPCSCPRSDNEEWEGEIAKNRLETRDQQILTISAPIGAFKIFHQLCHYNHLSTFPQTNNTIICTISQTPDPSNWCSLGQLEHSSTFYRHLLNSTRSILQLILLGKFQRSL